MALTPPPIRPVAPPSDAPSKWRITWRSLLGKPTSLDEAGLTHGGTITGPLTIKAKGRPPLILNRQETVPAPGDPYEVIEIQRNGHVVAAFALNASDHLVVLAPDLTTVLAEFDTDGTFIAPKLTALVEVKTPKVLDADANQVVGHQQGAIADATVTTSSGGGGGADESDPAAATVGNVNAAFNAIDDAFAAAAAAQATAESAVAAINALLASDRTHGLIAP